jgi:hypothetical protein
MPEGAIYMKGCTIMRGQSAFCVGLLLLLVAGAQAGQQDEFPLRYSTHTQLRDYSQATPQEALASFIKAIDDKRIPYLLAQLTDPDFVDKRVKEVYGGRFDELVREVRTKLADNPNTTKELQRFLKEGEWETGETTASVKLKDVKDRQAFLRKVGNRWYLENRQK